MILQISLKHMLVPEFSDQGIVPSQDEEWHLRTGERHVISVFLEDSFKFLVIQSERKNWRRYFKLTEDVCARALNRAKYAMGYVIWLGLVCPS